MELKTFDTILTQICDNYDSLISPRKIARSNNNIIYLIFKAISKGYETINNVCVVSSRKFDPEKCSDEDLVSVAKLVGTEKLLGSASGLRITVTNTTALEVALLKGTYTYALDEDTIFEFEVINDTPVTNSNPITYIAMSQKVGSFPVTEQPSITVESTVAIDSNLSFSCEDNSAILGIPEESNFDFRNRILTDTSRQSAIEELQLKIRNLPYIFDCKIKYNNTSSSIVEDGVTIKPYTIAIFYSGEAKQEIAQVVASSVMLQTATSDTSIALTYNNDIFVGGTFAVNIIPFKTTDYSVNIIYKINELYTSQYDTEVFIKNELLKKFKALVHSDFITEDDYYNYLDSLNLEGVTILGINLKKASVETDYIEVPISRVPNLTEVTFEKV